MELSLRRLPAASRMRSGRTAASDDRGKPVSRPSTATAKRATECAVQRTHAPAQCYRRNRERIGSGPWPAPQPLSRLCQGGTPKPTYCDSLQHKTMVAGHRSVVLQLRTRSLREPAYLEHELEPLFHQLPPLSPERRNAFHLIPITPVFQRSLPFSIQLKTRVPSDFQTTSHACCDCAVEPI